MKLSNLSKTVDDVVDRLSKVDHKCQTSSWLCTTNITTHSNPYLQITVRACINEENENEKLKFNVMVHNLPESDNERPDERKQEDLDKLNDICKFLSTLPINVTNAVRLGRRNEGSTRLLKVKLGDIYDKKRLLRYITKLKSFHKDTGRDSLLYMTPDLTPSQRLENEKLQNELRMKKDNGELGSMIRGRR